MEDGEAERQAIELVDVGNGQRARWDKAKGILIDPPFGPWPRPRKPRGIEFQGRLYQADITHLRTENPRRPYVTQCIVSVDGFPEVWTIAECSKKDLHFQRDRLGPEVVMERGPVLVSRTRDKRLDFVHADHGYYIFARPNRRLGRLVAIGRACKQLVPDDRRKRHQLLAALINH